MKITRERYAELCAMTYYTPEMRRWLHGYEPTTWLEITSNANKQAHMRRAAQMSKDAGRGFGDGTIKGLTKRIPS
jgi:hypothetical protein